MKKVLQFTKIRIPMFIVSVLLIAGGITGLILQGGFNLGIDFQAGLNLRVQIAEEAMTMTYTGEGDTTVNVGGNTLTIVTAGTEEGGEYAFPFDSYNTIGELNEAIAEVPGLSTTLMVDSSVATERIVGFSFRKEMGEDPVYLNVRPGNEDAIFAPIERIRSSLTGLENMQIQGVGNNINQEYIIRVEDPGDVEDFSSEMATRIVDMLGAEFGENAIIQKQTDYVGPRFSQLLGQQVVYLTFFALLLILAYIWFRFRLAFAVSAIIALVHDVVIMLGFIGTFQIEVSTATIAAVLTIIGYSLNDTIVIFDRVRENVGLLRDSDFETIINTSISQSLSRTLLTSLTTLLGVTAIFIFGSGAIKDFALNLMVGIGIGTYSSMFVASPILLGWTNTQEQRRKRIELEKYGRKAETPKPAAATTENASQQTQETATSTKEKTTKEPKTPTAPTPKKRKPSSKKKRKKKKKK